MTKAQKAFMAEKLTKKESARWEALKKQGTVKMGTCDVQICCVDFVSHSGNRIKSLSLEISPTKTVHPFPSDGVTCFSVPLDRAVFDETPNIESSCAIRSLIEMIDNHKEVTAAVADGKWHISL